MNWEALFAIVTVFTVGIMTAIGMIMPAFAEGNAAARALESMSRTPDAANLISRTLFVSLALIESTAIYTLVIALILLFANPLTGMVR